MSTLGDQGIAHQSSSMHIMDFGVYVQAFIGIYLGW